tara:strand:- start:1607 stop:1834 length:228 start_codon:yes stop_codon:yes gene_type:complete
MALLTTIAGIPLYTTTQEALSWAAQNGLSGYHIHNWQGQVGYMGGTSHIEATGLPMNSNAPPSQSNNTGGGGSGY